MDPIVVSQHALDNLAHKCQFGNSTAVPLREPNDWQSWFQDLPEIMWLKTLPLLK
jgi:hypothetical protein